MTTADPTAFPSGAQLEIAAGGYRAVVVEGGAALRVLSLDGRDLVDGFAEDARPSGGRGQLLVPWPNRIRDGSYQFDDEEQQLPITEPSRHNASHGLVRWVAWSVEQHTEDALALQCRLMAQPGYPWSLGLTVRYELSSDGLRVTQSATNLADGPAPYASGAHPYLRAGAGPVDGWRLHLPAAVRLLSDDRKLPTHTEPVAGAYDFRTEREVGDTVLDDAFTELTRDGSGIVTVEVADPGSSHGVQLWIDEHHRWVMVYSGDDLPDPAARRRSLAVEPMTAPPDAFRTGQDLVVLAPAGRPGSTWSASWGIRATA